MAAPCLNFCKKFDRPLLKYKKFARRNKIKNPTLYKSLLYLLMAAVLMFPSLGQGSISVDSPDPFGLIQVISPKASIKIDHVKGLTMKAGDTLPLFQENEKYFIALAANEYGEPALAAFARKNFQNQASAWVTAQKSLVFAREVSARSGKFYLRKGENLPVLQEHRKTYDVTISRYGKNHRMEVSKKLRGIHYRPDAELPPELRPKEVQVKKITLADLPPSKKAQPIPASSSKVEKTPSSLRDVNDSFLASTMKKVAAVFEKEPESLGNSHTDKSENTVDRAVYYRPKGAYVEAHSQTETTFSANLIEALQENSIAINMVLTLLILLAILFARKQRIPLFNQADPSATKATEGTEDTEETEITKPFEMPPPMPKEAEAAGGKPPAFTGSLEVFNIQNLVQFLHNSSSTGVLNLQVDGLSDPGRVILNMGEVKHATFDGTEGNAAFLKIFGLHRGSFRFQLSQQTKTKETIQTETSRLIDETAKIVALQNEQKIIKFGQAG
jgi:hypothetical protein